MSKSYRVTLLLYRLYSSKVIVDWNHDHLFKALHASHTLRIRKRAICRGLILAQA